MYDLRQMVAEGLLSPEEIEGLFDEDGKLLWATLRSAVLAKDRRRHRHATILEVKWETAMAEGFKYGRYEIYPSAQQLHSGQWIPVVSVVRHLDSASESQDQVFKSFRVEFDQQDAAMAYAAQAGRDLVDGKVQGLTI